MVLHPFIAHAQWDLAAHLFRELDAGRQRLGNHLRRRVDRTLYSIWPLRFFWRSLRQEATFQFPTQFELADRAQSQRSDGQGRIDTQGRRDDGSIQDHQSIIERVSLVPLGGIEHSSAMIGHALKYIVTHGAPAERMDSKQRPTLPAEDLFEAVRQGAPQ